MAPEVREKSGVWYRLNRWREEQITSRRRPTYGDLVRQYIALNRMERFEKIPQVRYINFLAEFLAERMGTTRAEAIAAWKHLKKLDAPKNYASWARAQAKPKGHHSRPQRPENPVKPPKPCKTPQPKQTKRRIRGKVVAG